jgi:uncharacterized protein YaaN involved in tellurite resistance
MTSTNTENTSQGQSALPGTELLPEVSSDLVSYSEADSSKKEIIDRLMKEIDLKDSNSIIFFGSKAQEQLTTISDSMLESVRNKDLGSAGKSLNEMVTVLRGFDVDELDPNQEQGFFKRLFAKLFGSMTPVARFIQQYEDVRKQIDVVTDNLEGHKTTLLRDITSLDKLYTANLEYFHNLELYISAGEEHLRIIETDLLPKLEQEASSSENVLKAQTLRDMRSDRNDLERRIHDLKLTRQVSMQGIPSIRLVQENDKGLVNKINSTLVNTVPLWRQQLAQAVTIYRSAAAAKDVKAASDLTNELLEKNAENLRDANREVREQMERGIYDIESIKRANQNLIATIEESLQIADEGKRRRAEAESQLQNMETELRQSLASAHGRSKTEPGADATQEN